MAMSAADPKFITYLLDPNEKYEFYYTVGNHEHDNSIETIGVVKKMLSAHSPVFRKELHESKLRDKKTAAITDIFPATFKNLLRYVYGHDNTSALSFNDADDLLYVADKYMVDNLKNNLCSHLMMLLTPENVCALMNNPAVYRQLEINSEITRLIQYETGKVLSSPEFPGLCSDAFLKILEQEQLSVPEIELWRAAVSWAKGRVGSEDGPSLRKELVKHVQHIRVCTIPLEQFCQEVAPSQVLNDPEVVQICVFLGNKDKKPDLKEICDVTTPRSNVVQYKKSELQKATFPYYQYIQQSNPACIEISTSASRIELCSLVLLNRNDYSTRDCTVNIELLNSEEPVTPITVVRANVQLVNNEYNVVMSDDDKPVHLLPNKRYEVTVSSDEYLDQFYTEHSSNSSGSHFTVHYFDVDSGFYTSCVKSIEYKTLECT